MRTIASAAAELASGKTTALKLAEECLERAFDPAGEGKNVFMVLEPEKIRAQARASDLLREQGIVPSPLAGIPISVKDLLDVRGEVTRAGSLALADQPPAKEDAPVIARLRAAGAVLFGRTNMTEFAYSGVGINPHYGTPASPWDRKTRRVPGGSSSGATVSVADGMAIAALGTDTGGSCRIPAALCGTVGYKPTASRIPLDGCTPLSFSLDSIGSFGNSTHCVAMIDAVMAGQPIRPIMPRSLKGLRVGVLKTIAMDGLDEHVSRAFARALGALSSAGCTISEIDMPFLPRTSELFEKGGLTAAESSHWHRELISRQGNVYDPRVRVRIELGLTQTAAEYLQLIKVRKELSALFDAATRDLDVLVMPATPIVAPPVAAFESDDDFRRLNLQLLRNTMIGNLMDRCSISLPCEAPGEPPVGFMAVGERGEDDQLFSVSAALEPVIRGAYA